MQFTPILGKRIRVTPLDDCGNIPDGGNAFVTDGFIRVSLSTEVEDGNEIMQRKADGSICVNEKMSDSFKYFTLEIQLCGVNPELVEFISNAKGYDGYDNEPIGFTVGEGEITDRFAFELWTGLAGGDCGEDGQAYGYVLLPQVVAGVLDDFEVTGEDTIDITITGAVTKGGNQWGTGPYDVTLNGDDPAEPDVLPTALDSGDHLLMIYTDVAPPASADSAQLISSFSTPPLPAGFAGGDGGEPPVVYGAGYPSDLGDEIGDGIDENETVEV